MSRASIVRIWRSISGRPLGGFAILAICLICAFGSLRALAAPAAPPVQAIGADELWIPASGAVFDFVAKPAPARATADFLAEWPRLVDADAPWEPSADAPHLPSSCLEIGDHACIACFSKAYASIDFVHATLERLRAIYGATKAMSDQAIATGDRLAPALGAAEGEWQHQRSEIVQSMVDLRGTYRTKYDGLVTTLATALASIDRCERLVYGEDRWYERYGASFSAWVQSHYRMND